MPQFKPRPTKRAKGLRNNATKAERTLWLHLSRRQLKGIKLSRQMPVGPYFCDFLCREHQLVIEVDGGQHAESERDRVRTAYLEQQGYRIIRFWNNDVLENVEGVLQIISEAIEVGPPPAPSRLREGKSREAAKGWA
jgi:very-short-patch-repair endonuclease